VTLLGQKREFWLYVGFTDRLDSRLQISPEVRWKAERVNVVGDASSAYMRVHLSSRYLF
jgi:hypothetical protein